jgi:response regulator RpfG family c-di-GMP phosphodiesterase
MKTVLLAEDNKGMALLCKRGLEDEGYKVLLAYDGEEACQAVQDNTPDVVILDISMPRVGGLEALARIKEVYQPVEKVDFASTASCVFPEEFDASMCHLWAFFNGLLSRHPRNPLHRLRRRLHNGSTRPTRNCMC